MNRAVKAYLLAVELEADSEAIYHKTFRVTGSATRIPRVLSLLEFIKRHQWAVNAFLPLLSWCYALIFAPTFFLFRAGRIALQMRARVCIDVELAHGKDLYLATSSGTNLAFLPQGASTPDFIITTPFRGGINAEVLPDAPRLPVLNFVHLSDIAWAWGRAVCANLYLLREAGGARVLWGYTALDWFLIYRVMLKLQPKAIWISNQSDRWLILASSVPGSSVNLVQHGNLFYSCENGEKLFYTRSTKLKNVKSIFTIDSYSKILFSKYIDTSQVKFSLINVLLKIGDWREVEFNTVKILLIGGSGDLMFYIKLIEAINEKLDMNHDIAIRHHPLQRTRIGNSKIWETENSDPIPAADLVVTYGSSIDAKIKETLKARIVTYVWSDSVKFSHIAEEINTEALEVISKAKFHHFTRG